MDLTNDYSDNLVVQEALDVGKIVTGFAGNIRRKAQLRKALELVKKGRGDEMNGGMIDRLIEAGVPPEYYNTTPVWLARPGNIAKAAEQTKVVKDPNAVVDNNVSFLKKNVIYIVIGILAVVIIFFVWKRK